MRNAQTNSKRGVFMKKTLIWFMLICLVLAFFGCNKQTKNEESFFESESNVSFDSSVASETSDYISSQPSDSSENSAFSIDVSEFMIDPYGYADTEYKEYMQTNPIDTLVNERIETASYQELDTVIQNGISIWEEEIDYAINQLFKDLTDETLQNKFLEQQKAWETFAQGEVVFDEKLIYSNKLGGYAVDFGLSYRYMLLCRERALHIKYLHYMMECSISDREITDYLSLVFKNK